MWIWSRMDRVKWIDKIKNAVVVERVGIRLTGIWVLSQGEHRLWARTHRQLHKGGLPKCVVS